MRVSTNALIDGWSGDGAGLYYKLKFDNVVSGNQIKVIPFSSITKIRRDNVNIFKLKKYNLKNLHWDRSIYTF